MISNPLRSGAFLAVSLISALPWLSGCANLGHRAIQASRTDYNVALGRTNGEQFLLNLVRLRYREPVLFLEASALSTQFLFGGSAGFGAEAGPSIDDTYIPNAGVSFEEKPTVTYTPLRGEQFVQRLLAPIPLETILLMDTSGWSSERLLRTCVKSMNGLPNAPRADGPTPRTAPEYERFLRAAKLIRALEVKNLFEGALQDRGGAKVLQFRPEAADLPEYRELMGLLRLDPAALVYPLTDSASGGPAGANTITLRTRSLLGVMYFLSQSVDPPADDVRAGRVTVTLDGGGAPFDWSRAAEGIMRIRSSASPPRNAAVSVRYRGAWFYIDDSDLESKSTFSMLDQLFALQSGSVESIAPVLTLPVGG